MCDEGQSSSFINTSRLQLISSVWTHTVPHESTKQYHWAWVRYKLTRRLSAERSICCYWTRCIERTTQCLQLGRTALLIQGWLLMGAVRLQGSLYHEALWPHEENKDSQKAFVELISTFEEWESCSLWCKNCLNVSGSKRQDLVQKSRGQMGETVVGLTPNV